MSLFALPGHHIGLSNGVRMGQEQMRSEVCAAAHAPDISLSLPLSQVGTQLFYSV